MTYSAYYTGIGSRSTPDFILKEMTAIADKLEHRGYTLRSGGAAGADSAFEKGVKTFKQIYLPWNGFNGRYADGYTVFPQPTIEAMELAQRFHPAWGSCTRFARLLHARNSHQVLGRQLNKPSHFVVCWTPNASGSGGTGQALRIARHYHIPIYDLADKAQYDALRIDRLGGE